MENGMPNLGSIFSIVLVTSRLIGVLHPISLLSLAFIPLPLLLFSVPHIYLV